MSFDVVTADRIAQGAAYIPPPISFDGFFVEPGTATLSSQATGTGATVLVARHSGGRVKVGSRVVDLPPAETTLVNTTSYMTSGQAQWFTLVFMSHPITGALSAMWVAGTVAALASVAKPTLAQIRTALGIDDTAMLGIAGDIQFYRSGDLVVTAKCDSTQRPGYVDTGSKTGLVADQADTSNLGERFWGFMDLPISLAPAYGVGVATYTKGMRAPPFRYGGRIGKAEYVPTVTSTGTGAAMSVAPAINDTVVTGGDVALTLANTALGQTAVQGTTPTAANLFGPNDTLGIKVTVATTAFTAGSGVLRVAVWERVPRAG